MTHVTLTVPYIRKVAATYRHLKQGGTLPTKELTTVALAAARCIKAAPENKLSLAPDVLLPIDAVLRMLTEVQRLSTMQLQHVPAVPTEPVVTVEPPAPRSFLQRLMARASAVLTA